MSAGWLLLVVQIAHDDHFLPDCTQLSTMSHITFTLTHIHHLITFLTYIYFVLDIQFYHWILFCLSPGQNWGFMFGPKQNTKMPFKTYDHPSYFSFHRVLWKVKIIETQFFIKNLHVFKLDTLDLSFVYIIWYFLSN